MSLVKITLAMTIFTIIVAISMLIGIAVSYEPQNPDDGIVETPEEEPESLSASLPPHPLSLLTRTVPFPLW